MAVRIAQAGMHGLDSAVIDDIVSANFPGQRSLELDFVIT